MALRRGVSYRISRDVKVNVSFSQEDRHHARSCSHRLRSSAKQQRLLLQVAAVEGERPFPASITVAGRCDAILLTIHEMANAPLQVA